MLGQETQQWPIDSEEEANLHRIAEEVLDETAQEDGRSGLVVEDGQPERVEAQVDEDHDEEERDAGAPQRDALAVKEPAVDIACEKAGDEKAREEDTRAEQGRANEVSGHGNETSLHGPVHCTIDGNRQEPERDTHEDCLDGKDIGKEDSQGHGDTSINEWLDGDFGHEKRPSFPLCPLLYVYRYIGALLQQGMSLNVFHACSSEMQCLHHSPKAFVRISTPLLKTYKKPYPVDKKLTFTFHSSFVASTLAIPKDELLAFDIMLRRL